ncbi:uncharacterized protein Z520_02121 [Fonsecaea multimorphosa CBS 102226]|uniref:Uncharacterized protein n=1 Tax=Fonsecaea multimorphosa CBS 102226 TaxID=1442371 RepID=A0A0D2K7K2_9EURO|nr:uncharacterized protein Z520_02121 [Fonsecaea multimorphosa CBS 102226]KIY01983.1 hypothetical protein Z520_02121 [Fonsecaea multimorphosa CBS 102226]OAL29665.1 hypothetical protein AYO22_02079 [Fonsecaea multimorphosa]
MAPSPPAVTDGSKTWSPSHLFFDDDADDDNTASPETWDRIHAHLRENEFRAAITTAFELPAGDNFTYHATASVNLAQAEAAVRAGRKNGLHAWYVEAADTSGAGSTDAAGQSGDGDGDGDERTIPGQPSLRISGYPPPSDIQAYISIFDPTKSAANSLKSLAANAKKGSLRAGVAEYLLKKRHLDPSITVPKFKPLPTAGGGGGGGNAAQQDGSDGKKQQQQHENPALEFWAYSCMALEFAGPNVHTAQVKMSHHLLPVYMHHFGCVCPSWEALQVIAKLAASITKTGNGGSGGKGAVLDMGSGNGYWTHLLRRLGTVSVTAVDSGQSRWRTVWIPDTQVSDGVSYLRKRAGCPDSLLLLVYPIVGGEFTRKVLDAYAGDVVCVAGTQNGNGYTGFKDVMVDEYMAREKPRWDKVAQVALPSFAGKDDALFAFRRRR